MPQDPSRTVWSSEQGDLRKKSDKPAATPTSLPPQQQTVYLHRESKGRVGKVILLRGLALSKDDSTALCKTIKQACGTGGTVKEGVIEIQGEQREKIAELLKKLGYKVKLAGG